MWENVVIKNATFIEIDYLLKQADIEGWNPGLSDTYPFFAIDPNGFFIGKLNDQPIGCISAVAYDQNYGFLGFYIVSSKYRGLGYGLKLWNQALLHLGDRTIGLDGVVAQQENYKRSGFKLFYNNIRYGGKISGAKSKALKSVKSIPFETLLNFDRSIFGLDRGSFLKSWIQMPNAYGLAKLTNHCLEGYGVIRECVHGYKIGPLFANSYEIAEEIFLALTFPFKDNEFFLDVPQVNKEGVLLAEKHGLKKVFETARMYKGEPLLQELSKIFGVTTFEVG